ncbi:MAG TPA: NUDIX hydrolase [Acidimicrobiales bacterium]|nr:NUDIX hydrolase [Acidimicrobiales bacterium]
MSEPAGFRQLGEETLWKGHVVSAARGRFVGPDGTEFEREVVRHPGAVSVVPLRDDGTVILVRQYRSAVDRELLEIPAGKCDVAGEDRALTARRELEEEIGIRAGRLDHLCDFLNSPGFCDESSSIFLARDLEACPTDTHGVEEQHMTIEHVALADVPSLIASGAIVDAKTIIGLLLALQMSTGGRDRDGPPGGGPRDG